jgi:hypothetical protein
MPGLIVCRHGRSGEDETPRVVGMVIHVASDLIPDVIDKLPLIDEAWFGAVEEERRVQLSNCARRGIPIKEHGARSLL